MFEVLECRDVITIYIDPVRMIDTQPQLAISTISIFHCLEYLIPSVQVLFSDINAYEVRHLLDCSHMCSFAFWIRICDCQFHLLILLTKISVICLCYYFFN